MFQGSIVALITPMTPTYEIDFSRFRALIEMHIDQGTSAIVVSGTTGESSTLTEAEKNKLLQVAIETSAGKLPIIMGTGTNSTAETIRRTQEAMELGADACLIVTPYYNKPTQKGLLKHYTSIAENVPLPIILYNNPGRTACDLLPETVGQLAQIPNIIGIKEASSDLARGRALLAACGNALDLFSGDDPSALAFMLQGGRGVISITANVAPKAMQDMCMAALESNIRVAGEINTKLMPLHKALCIEPNPIPVKWVLQQLDLIQEGIRLPLTPLSPEHYAHLKEAMQESGAL